MSYDIVYGIRLVGKWSDLDVSDHAGRIRVSEEPLFGLSEELQDSPLIHFAAAVESDGVAKGDPVADGEFLSTDRGDVLLAWTPAPNPDAWDECHATIRLFEDQGRASCVVGCRENDHDSKAATALDMLERANEPWAVPYRLLVTPRIELRRSFPSSRLTRWPLLGSP